MNAPLISMARLARRLDFDRRTLARRLAALPIEPDARTGSVRLYNTTRLAQIQRQLQPA